MTNQSKGKAVPTRKRKTPRKKGRPSKYTTALADEICRRLAKGETLTAICKSEHMPDRSNVTRWLIANESFSQRIARAREDGADAIAEDALRIADDGTNDTITTEEGSQIVNHEVIQRSKLRVETRLKLLAKWFPKRYGEKVDVEHKGEVNVRVVIGGGDA